MLCTMGFFFGTLNTLIPFTLACGVIALWMSVDETGGLLVAILYDHFLVVRFDLPPTIVPLLA
jgi:hypothetical protein